MAETKEDSRDHYQKSFTPEGYRDFIVGMMDEVGNYAKEWKFMYMSALELAKEYDFKGDTLLDLGSGPTVFGITGVAQNFKEIVLSEFVDTCREELKHWVNKEPCSTDWTRVMEYAAQYTEHDDAKAGGIEIGEMIRKKVKDVVYCDVLSDDIIPVEFHGPYDALISSLTIESARPDYERYKYILRKLNSFIKLGGKMILKGFINIEKWPCGGFIFPYLKISQDDVQKALEAAGFGQIVWRLTGKNDADGIPFDFAHALICVKEREL